MGSTADPVAWLRSAAAVRQRCHHLLDVAEAGGLAGLRIDGDRWDHVREAVAQEVLRTHPEGDIPVHGRLNHLRFAATDRSGATERSGAIDLAARLLAQGPAVLDAVVVSVLLDAGAGPAWAFPDPEVGPVGRSEGLAAAAFRLVEAGHLASDGRAFGIDADGLAGLEEATLAAAFAVSADNPLTGLPGRVAVVRALGEVLRARGSGSLAEALAADLLGGRLEGALPAPDLLAWLLRTLADLWPGRLRLDGHNLGDTWRHPAADGDGPTGGLVPFHKLTQWLTWSLVEPLAGLGVEVTDTDGLTGLAEYRNGGMLIDLGLVALTDPVPTTPVAVEDPLVVGWRAVTVAALDRIVAGLDDHLPATHRGLGMGQVLEAGTWSLGRRLAAQARPGAVPPFPIASDGTVF